MNVRSRMFIVHRSSLIVDSSAFPALFILEIVGETEAGAGGGVHLLRRIDRVLQFGDAVLHLGQLFLDLILQIRDLLLRHLKRCLVELLLLIGDDRHSSLLAQKCGADYSLKSTRTGVHDFTRTPSFVPGENVERLTLFTAASLRMGFALVRTRVSMTCP